MNAREVYNAIETGNREDQRQALFELLTLVNALSFAVLELAGSMKRCRQRIATVLFFLMRVSAGSVKYAITSTSKGAHQNETHRCDKGDDE